MLSSAEILLRLAEIAYEPNDGHLDIFEKVVKLDVKLILKSVFSLYWLC